MTRPAKTVGAHLAKLLAAVAPCGPWSCGGGPSPDRLVLDYIDAANRHDLAWVRGHLADSVTWELMGDVLQGRDRVLAPHEQDRVMHTFLEPTLRGVAGDTVVVDPFGGATVPFFAWVRRERPEDWAALLDPEGEPRYGADNGRLLMELARAWRGR